jgi:hypothetical protein
MTDIKQLITRLGGPVAVGKAVSLTHSAVCQWDRIPADYLVQLEKHSIERGSPVYRDEMRPDLFNREPSS